jgi:hypothetical protein
MQALVAIADSARCSSISISTAASDNHRETFERSKCDSRGSPSVKHCHCHSHSHSHMSLSQQTVKDNKNMVLIK